VFLLSNFPIRDYMALATFFLLIIPACSIQEKASPDTLPKTEPQIKQELDDINHTEIIDSIEPELVTEVDFVEIGEII